MITTKKELEFYIQADIIMNDGGGVKKADLRIYW